MCEIRAVCSKIYESYPVQIAMNTGRKLFELNARFDDAIVRTLINWKCRLKAFYESTVTHLITLIVLPCLTRTISDATDDIAAINQANGTLRAEAVTLGPLDGPLNGLLDGLFLIHKNVETKDQKVVVFHLGNYGIWQDNVHFFKALAEMCKVDILCYNYRGVGQKCAEPKDEQEVINDGVNQVLSLITKCVHPNHILLFGQGLGANFSFLIAHSLAERGITVHAGGDNPIKSLAAVIKARYPRIGGLVAHFLKGKNFQLNAQQAVEKLPGKVILMQSAPNSLIPEPAILKSTAKPIISIKMENFVDQNNHSRPYTKKEVEALKAAISTIW